MALSRINHNISAINANRNLTTSGSALSKSLERLSSGLRINRAADDAAGLTISEKMRGQINGLNQAVRNSQDGVSLIQTAEGAMDELHAILQRMRVLSVQAASDVNTSQDRTAIQQEITALIAEVDRISGTTEFNTKKLLDGSSGVLVSTGQTYVGNMSATADTAAGPLVVTAGATAAMTVATTGTRTNGAGTFTGGITTAVSTISINNSTYTYSAGISISTVAGDINGNAGASGVQASFAGTTLTLTTTTVGSAARITIGAGPTGSFTGMVSAAGTDATISPGSSATANFSGAITAYRATGNTIEVLQGTMMGLKFDVLSNTPTIAPLTTILTVGTNNSTRVQVGANAGQTISVGIQSMSASSLAINNLNVTTHGSATAAITSLDSAINTVSTQRSALGALQNRLEHTINNLGVAAENITASESRIRDADVAYETTIFTRNQIMQQAGTSILGQANLAPQSMLSLLRG